MKYKYKRLWHTEYHAIIYVYTNIIMSELTILSHKYVSGNLNQIKIVYNLYIFPKIVIFN